MFHLHLPPVVSLNKHPFQNQDEYDSKTPRRSDRVNCPNFQPNNRQFGAILNPFFIHSIFQLFCTFGINWTSVCSVFLLNKFWWCFSSVLSPRSFDSLLSVCSTQAINSGMFTQLLKSYDQTQTANHECKRWKNDPLLFPTWPKNNDLN